MLAACQSVVVVPGGRAARSVSSGKVLASRPVPAARAFSQLSFAKNVAQGISSAVPVARARAQRAQRTIVQAALKQPGKGKDDVTVVMKFGGSSVRDAERMREVANIICSFPDQLPAVVLSAMGKTTNNLLQAGEEAMKCKSTEVGNLEPLKVIRNLHLKTCQELNLPKEAVAEIEALLEQLQQLLTGISLMQELTSRTKANLVSFGERMATRIFAAYLRTEGIAARQYDSFGRLGFVSSDDYSNGDILPETYPVVRAVLGEASGLCEIPIVTGFLARAKTTGAIATLGRGGSDLTATVLGRALCVKEVQVWKDVDGVLTADPRVVPNAVPVPFLTYEEATELAYFGAQVLHPQAMRPAIESRGELNVRVKNSYNINAPGTLITRARDKRNTLLTSVVRKGEVTMLDIVSTRMLGQFGFLSSVFQIMAANQISVDVVATSEVSVSLTLDPAKLWSRQLIPTEMERIKEEFAKIAEVSVSYNYAILSLIGNVERSNEILERTFRALGRKDIKVKMISQGASKVNISLLVEGEHADDAVRAIHDEFFAQEDDKHAAPAGKAKEVASGR